jgi:hypothetical protein
MMSGDDSDNHEISAGDLLGDDPTVPGEPPFGDLDLDVMTDRSSPSTPEPPAPCPGGTTMSVPNRILASSALATALLAAGVAHAVAPRSASPGAADRVLAVDTRCPTFAWEAVPGALHSELAVYRVPPPGEDLAEEAVLRAIVPGGIPAWVPPAADCLPPGGSYVWFVRAVYETADEEVIDASDWSPGHYFAVPAVPSAAELQRALEVLRSWEAGSVGDEGAGSEAAAAPRPEADRRGALAAPAPKLDSVPGASAAIRGDNPETVGEAYGVIGITAAAAGAGLAGANSNGGADLVLDGSLDGTPDLAFDESGAWRSSALDETFYLWNTGGGKHHLEVLGDITGENFDANSLDVGGTATVGYLYTNGMTSTSSLYTDFDVNANDDLYVGDDGSILGNLGVGASYSGSYKLYVDGNGIFTTNLGIDGTLRVDGKITNGGKGIMKSNSSTTLRAGFTSGTFGASFSAGQGYNITFCITGFSGNNGNIRVMPAQFIPGSGNVNPGCLLFLPLATDPSDPACGGGSSAMVRVTNTCSVSANSGSSAVLYLFSVATD